MTNIVPNDGEVREHVVTGARRRDSYAHRTEGSNEEKEILTKGEFRDDRISKGRKKTVAKQR